MDVLMREYSESVVLGNMFLAGALVCIGIGLVGLFVYEKKRGKEKIFFAILTAGIVGIFGEAIVIVSAEDQVEVWEKDNAFILYYGEVERYKQGTLIIEPWEDVELYGDGYDVEYKGDLQLLEVDHEVSDCRTEVYMVTSTDEVWYCGS